MPIRLIFLSFEPFRLLKNLYLAISSGTFDLVQEECLFMFYMRVFYDRVCRHVSTVSLTSVLRAVVILRV